jgi:hypothetical protein
VEGFRETRVPSFAFWLGGLNPRLLQDITSGPQHLATAAYAVASLTLATGACSALAREGNALRMLYTAPERLEICSCTSCACGWPWRTCLRVRRCYWLSSTRSTCSCRRCPIYSWQRSACFCPQSSL